MIFIYMSMIDTEEDKTKFELVYEKYRKLMFFVANQILQDDSLAEDAVHDSFIKIIKNFHQLGDINCHKTKSYIVAIVRNHSINLYNNRKKKPLIPFEEVEHPIVVDMELEYMDDLNFGKYGDLGNAIMKLPLMYRDIITLKFLHEFTNEEIASALDINEATVRKRIERAKRKIQDLLRKEVI